MRLSEEQKERVKKLRASGESATNIAARFGVSRGCIERIVGAKRQYYKPTGRVRTPEEYQEMGRLGALAAHGRRLLDDEQITKIKALIAEGLNRKAICERYGVSNDTLKRSLKRSAVAGV